MMGDPRQPYHGFHVARDFLDLLWNLDVTDMTYHQRYSLAMHVHHAYGQLDSR